MEIISFFTLHTAESDIPRTDSYMISIYGPVHFKRLKHNRLIEQSLC